MNYDSVPPALLEQLRGLSTCVVSSAIETFDVRLPNVGFTDSTVRCIFPDFPAVAGYAVTAKVRSAAPPMSGRTYYYWRTDWWQQILAIPEPRIVVLQDEDDPPGLGAFVGEVHSSILRSLGCVALVTNGAVRDLPEVRAKGLQLFAGNVSVSHAYAHISSFGEMVVVGRLKIRPGELLLGDLHGVVSIPLHIAARVPAVAQGILERRKHVVGLCRAEGFTLECLEAAEEQLKVMEDKEREMMANASPKRART
jgi:regulator of RNase E activity RraA